MNALQTRQLKVGRLFGLDVFATPSAVGAYLVLWKLATALAASSRFGVRAHRASAGLLITLVHVASVLAHHGGHAWSARRTGHGMQGVRLWGLLGTSLYPPDEPRLPAGVHYQRALGGPLMSLLVAGVLLVIVRSVRLRSMGMSVWVLRLAVADNAVVLGLGAFAPLSFSDGGTLMELLRGSRADVAS